MISKKLLGEVLGVKVNEYHFGMLGNYVEYDELKSINIYELAHKVKEWAYNLGFELNSYKALAINTYKVLVYKDGDGFEDFRLAIDEDTEPEAIFKVGEWILEKKDKR